MDGNHIGYKAVLTCIKSDNDVALLHVFIIFLVDFLQVWHFVELETERRVRREGTVRGLSEHE